MNEQITLKEIAKILNVSISTVSRALKDHPRIGKKTKDAIVELANKLEYQPNVLALNLLHNRTNTIGVIVPKISYHFYSLAISGIEEVAIKAGFNIMICQSNESYEREIINTHDLSLSRVAGMIVSLAGGTKEFNHFHQIEKKNIPLIFFNRVCDEINTSKVIVENSAAAFEATQHLIDQGCKRIAFLAGPKSLHISNERKNGYVDALKKNNLAIDQELIVHNNFLYESDLSLIHQLLDLDKKPDGIFAMSDRLAINAMLVIKQKGLKIPEDIAVVGFNNDPVCALTYPTLTSVDQDAFEIGKIAANLFFKQLDKGKGVRQIETQSVKTRLIIRDSSSRRNRKN